MGLWNWWKHKSEEIQPMDDQVGYTLHPAAWSHSSQQPIDCTLEKAHPRSTATSELQESSWKEQADQILGDREWSAFLSLSSDERRSKLAQLQLLIQQVREASGEAELRQQYARLLNAEGTTTHSTDYFLKAREAFEQSLEIKPDCHFAWTNRGYSLSQLGQHEEAIASYSKAIEYQPDYYVAWWNYSHALNKLGRKEEAIAFYEKALELKCSVFHVEMCADNLHASQ